MVYLLRERGLVVEQQVSMPVIFEGVDIGFGYRLDLLVNDLVIVEIRYVENLQQVHHLQLLTYLKLSGLKLGLLVNFNTANIYQSIYRKVNGL